MDMIGKFDLLKSNIRSIKSLAVAFSGGVDSTFLLKAAYDVLGDNAIAITVKSPLHPQREFNEGLNFVKNIGVRQKVVEFDRKDMEFFFNNPSDRCYHCKKEIFKRIIKTAGDYNINNVADGSNMDDLDDYRPGIKALDELGIISPLRDSGLNKKEIRLLSKEMGLPTWEKPAFACLASRIPYGHEITMEKLSMIDKAEQFLMDLGFKQLRVRHHGEIARIEVSPEDRIRFVEPGLMECVYNEFRQMGFLYTSLDLKGYRTGSLNEAF